MKAGSSYAGPWLGQMIRAGYCVTFSMFLVTCAAKGIMISA